MNHISDIESLLIVLGFVGMVAVIVARLPDDGEREARKIDRRAARAIREADKAIAAAKTSRADWLSRAAEMERLAADAERDGLEHAPIEAMTAAGRFRKYAEESD